MPIKFENLVLYDLEELSQKMKVHRTTLRKYIQQGRIKAQKVGGTWLVSEDALREFFLRPNFPLEAK